VLSGKSGDEGAGRAVGAGVVAAIGRVGLAQPDLINRRCERRSRDLAMHRAGAVAELGRAHRELERAVIA
jgi:hypothetical protein